MEFEELFGDEFFIINSDNLNSIKKKLYGFGFNNRELILDDSDDFSNLNGLGSYVLVDVDEEFINISQDFNGCYGLYRYVNEDYFAISNSFLYLVEFLKDKQIISFNKDYADAFLFSDLCSFAYGETLINEIEVIPRNYKVIINKKEVSLNYDEIDYKEHSIHIDSKEGMKILDDWYFKWVNIIRNLKSKTNNIEIDLSGGMDTRIIAALWLTSNIDLNEIKIRSMNRDVHCIAEDYKIASQIANEFNFKLNDNSMMNLEQYVFKDIKTIFNISSYVKLGFHKQMYWKRSRFTSPYFSITGNGGAMLRSFFNRHTEEYISSLVNRAKRYDASLVKPTERIIRSGLLEVQKKLNIDDFNSKELPERYYKEVRGRNHFGKGMVEKYFSNIFTLSPLMDPDIHKIKIGGDDLNDRNLLFILIYLRYCPKLLDFDIEGGRKFNEDTIEQAKLINQKYAFENINEKAFVSFDKIEQGISYNKSKFSNPDLTLKKISDSNFFEVEFKKYYPSIVYNRLMSDIRNRKFFPLSNLYSALAILQMIDYVNFNNILNYSCVADWIQSFDKKPKCDCFEINSHKIEKYNTARVDLINRGEKNNSLEFIDISDDSAVLLFPDWFKSDEGSGSVIQTKKNPIKIKLRCINDGNLSIYVRGIDYRDSRNKKIPIYILFKKLLINDEVVFDDEKLVCNDGFYIKTIPVVDEEVISLYIEWASV